MAGPMAAQSDALVLFGVTGDLAITMNVRQ